MSVELIGIVAVGAALAGVMLTATRGLRQDMGRLEARLDGRIGGLESRLREDTGKMESRLRDDIKQLAERLLEGLREAISGRAAAS